MPNAKTNTAKIGCCALPSSAEPLVSPSRAFPLVTGAGSVPRQLWKKNLSDPVAGILEQVIFHCGQAVASLPAAYGPCAAMHPTCAVRGGCPQDILLPTLTWHGTACLFCLLSQWHEAIYAVALCCAIACALHPRAAQPLPFETSPAALAAVWWGLLLLTQRMAGRQTPALQPGASRAGGV